ncbi:hypothetical protein COJ37_23845 [Bacillus cereus]|uniref:hypothetical protein n=1 Tax=Bacillus cereus TaxID=1396 RepID=UPI000BF410C4|nr:hypothetical protein [Bacillus cereus]MCU4930852.1 hypothetical protein [Bacillus cereus]PES11117.1 hypothetical protein CN494_22715 [Bacillus cereus]PEY62930.1 hypothetical protein CN356_17995 [Bacillus cereus]PFC37650.1 hypothetical protein CN310_13685 [Bacillus cereus]PFJ90791.1 hypothetical protein COJ11_21300 [Bacillus cereus]
MYFSNEEHERNYLRLLDTKGIEPGDDPEYEVAFYITAYPEIYKCFDWSLYKLEYSPLGELIFPEDEVKGVNLGALTGTILPLVKAGQSLFNGYKVDLSDLPLYNGVSPNRYPPNKTKYTLK